MLTMARLPCGIATSSLIAWLRMRAPVAANGWPSAMLPPFGFTRSRGNEPNLCSTPAFFAYERFILETFDVTQRLRRERLVDFP
jgi:hypothetical protein